MKKPNSNQDPVLVVKNSKGQSVKLFSTFPVAHNSENKMIQNETNNLIQFSENQNENLSREVQPLEVKYVDELKPKELNFKSHFNPILYLVVFTVLLLVIAIFKEPKSNSNRNIAGEINDLSNISYQKETADYQEEKVCVDYGDGSQTCTTKTKINRSFK